MSGSSTPSASNDFTSTIMNTLQTCMNELQQEKIRYEQLKKERDDLLSSNNKKFEQEKKSLTRQLECNVNDLRTYRSRERVLQHCVGRQVNEASNYAKSLGFNPVVFYQDGKRLGNGQGGEECYDQSAVYFSVVNGTVQSQTGKNYEAEFCIEGLMNYFIQKDLTPAVFFGGPP